MGFQGACDFNAAAGWKWHGILRLPEEHPCCDWGEMGFSAGSAGVDKAS